MSYFGVSLRNGVGLGLGTVPSLTNTPLSYRLAPSLDLSFAGSDTLSPAITFSRTTNATLTNSAGLVANAPMNLLTFSEQFDNAAWSKTRASISANTTTAPDGTTTADKFVEDTSASNTHQTFRSTAVSAGTPYTFSVYIKADGRNFAGVRYENGASTQFYQANVNLTNGTATTSSIGSPTGTSFSVTSAGDAWWRVSITVTAADTSFASVVYLQSAQGSNSYTGNGVSGAFLWGAQLELGSTATTYNPTTVKNLLGFTENFDNAAWTKSNAFVQTNLVLQSQALATSPWATFIAGTGVTPTRTNNSGVAPDGTQTATLVQLSLGGGTTTADRSLVNQNLTPVVGTQYTLSIWVRSLSGNASFSLQGDGFLTPTTLTATSEWQRFVVTGTVSFASTPIGVQLRGGQTPAHSNSADLLVWGAQLVQGTSAGDYKATYAAAAAVGYTDIYGQPFAQKLVENTVNTQHIVQTPLAATATPYTYSAYLKAGERTWAALNIYDGVLDHATYFDLANGVLGTQTNATGAIVSIGNGWYRCSISCPLAAGTSFTSIRLANVNGNVVYTGDGTSGIYIFGAQLSDSASVDPYVYQPVAAPSSVAYYGPRFDYDPVTLAPKGLLIEEQRTNLLLQSENFSASWSLLRLTNTADALVSPDGRVTADLLLDTAVAGTHVAIQTITKAASSIVYTASVYLKAGVRTLGELRVSDQAGNGVRNTFNLTAGTVGTPTAFGTGFTAGTSTITSVGNGWYRVDLVATSNSATTLGHEVYIADGSGNTSYTGNGSGFYAWGAQLEAGAFATSYIPTVASQVTRAADSASMIGNNFARWYNQTEGTVYAEGITSPRTSASAQSENIVSLSGNLQMVRGASSFALGWFIGSTTFRSFGFTSANAAFKSAGGYKSGDSAALLNGTTTVTDAGTDFGSRSSMSIGSSIVGAQQINGTVKRIAYYNRRLSNTELQAITS